MKTFEKSRSIISNNNHRVLLQDGITKIFAIFSLFSFVFLLTAIPARWVQADMEADLEIQAQRATCEEGGVGGCYDDILGQQNDMIVEVDELLDAMDDAGLFSIIRAQTGVDAKADLKDRLDALKREHGRAIAVNAATSDDEYDNVLEKSDKVPAKNCKDSDMTFYNSLVEELNNPNDLVLPAGYTWVDTGSGKNQFGNGKCDLFDAEMEDEYGNIVTVKVNERKENMCEKICVDKRNAAGESRKGENKGRFLASMDEAISSSRNANLKISVQIARIHELGILFSELQSSRTRLANTDVCDVSGGDELGNLSAEEVLQIIITVFDGITVVTDIVVQVLDFVKDIAEKPCGQDVAGFNGNTACTPAVLVYHIANGLNDVMKNGVTILGDAKEFVALAAEQDEAQDSLDAKACTKQIRDEFRDTGKIVLLQEDVTTIDGKVNALTAAAGDTNTMLLEVKEALRLMNIIIEQNQDLLLMPAGQRENFNK